MIYLSTLLLSLFITLALVPPLRSLATRYSAVDIPNERKVHSRPIPKIGGLAIACGALIPILLWASLNDFGRALMLGASIIVVAGFLDDIMDLPYKVKFLAQITAALTVIHFGHLQLNVLGNLAPEDFQLPAALAVPLTVFVIVGVTNAINLSDGLDGLAGGITLMTFICLGYLAYMGEHYFTLTLSVAVIGAIFGFLRFNTYPAVIFMGGHRKPTSRVSGDLPFHLHYPGQPAFEPTAASDHSRVSDSRHPDRHDRKDHARSIPLQTG